jgi:hypothetical protein
LLGSDAERVVLRCAEFYRFANGRTSEIRAYYNQLGRSTETRGLDYLAREYSTVQREGTLCRILNGEGNHRF